MFVSKYIFFSTFIKYRIKCIDLQNKYWQKYIVIDIDKISVDAANKQRNKR